MARKSKSQRQWADLIEFTEARLEQSRQKIGELERILVVFQRQAGAGEPCPLEPKLLGNNLSKLLQQVKS